MTTQTGGLTPAPPSWLSLGLIGPVLLIPLAALLALLIWQDGEQSAFRVIQLCYGAIVFAQMIVVFARAFQRGWLELLAYVLHLVMIGAAALSVTFRLEQYPQDMLYDQFAVIGMSGQLALGVLALQSRPLQIQARLDPMVLKICALVVCTAAIVKFYFYIKYVGSAGGYGSIYTEGDAVRDNSPTVIRILSAGAPFIGLLALTFPRLPLWCRGLGALAILLEFAIGIRGRPLYIMMAALAIAQTSIRLTPARKLMIAGSALLAVLALAAIGYVREGNNSTLADYFWAVLQSLFGIFESGVLGAQLPDTPPIVVGQLRPLLFPTPLSEIDTVYKLLSVTYTPGAYLAGYGYSSSAMTEVGMLCGPVLSGLVYPIVVVGIVALIRGAITSRRTWFFLYGACVLPIAFYAWRAELWQMVVPALKAAPFILVLLGADAFARLGERRAAGPEADAEPATS